MWNRNNNNNASELVMIVSFVLLIIIIGGLFGDTDFKVAQQEQHYSVCEWDECDKLTKSCEDKDDCDSCLIYDIHVEHPSWSYVECEEYLFYTIKTQVHEN